MKRLLMAMMCAVLVWVWTQPVVGQASGVAIAALGNGSPLSGFVGPFRLQPDGIDVQYILLCYEPGTRRKHVTSTDVFLADGNTLAQSLTAATTAIIASCAELSIVVPRNLVLLPSFQFGQ